MNIKMQPNPEDANLRDFKLTECEIIQLRDAFQSLTPKVATEQEINLTAGEIIQLKDATHILKSKFENGHTFTAPEVQCAVVKNDASKWMSRFMKNVGEQCAQNKWALGIGEMAAGAGLIVIGIHIGHFQTDLLGTKLNGFNVESICSAVAGASVGAFAAAMLGSIGVVPFGGVCITAAQLIPGGAAVFGAAGYSAGDAVHNLLLPGMGVGQLLSGCSLLTMGLALLLDGARRIITDEKLRRMLSDLLDGMISSAKATAAAVADSLTSLTTMADALAHKISVDTTVSAATGLAGAATGAAVGSSIAVGSVTMLGSHALGGIALSLGIVSAPLWPVIACGGAGLVIGYGAWKGISLLLGGSDANAAKMPLP